MGMSIDDSIALLVDYLKWQKQQGMDGNGIDEATRNLIDVTRKYQKIEQILQEPCIIPEGCYPMLNKIKRVIKDEDVD